jgi:hypothetical protein
VGRAWQFPGPRPRTWACPECQASNATSDATCCQCGTRRPVYLPGLGSVAVSDEGRMAVYLPDRDVRVITQTQARTLAVAGLLQLVERHLMLAPGITWQQVLDRFGWTDPTPAANSAGTNAVEGGVSA